MLRKLIGLRTIAQIIHRNAAAEIDVFECQTGLAMNRHQMVPHALESFRERLDVRSLRPDVNMNPANVDQIGVLQTAAKCFENFRGRDAKF